MDRALWLRPGRPHLRYVLECAQEGAYNYEFCESYALEEHRELGEHWKCLGAGIGDRSPLLSTGTPLRRRPLNSTWGLKETE